MDPFTLSIVASIIANIVTEGGRALISELIPSNFYHDIEKAYTNALKQWSPNETIRDRERIWDKKRFQELILLITNPEKENEITKGTQDLLNFFLIEIQKNDSLWHYIQGQVFKTILSKQNETTDYLKLLVDEIHSNKIDPIELITRLQQQAAFQVQKNTISGKYIPQTFLEISDIKDQMRYFVSPMMFSEKIYSSISGFNFDYLNRYRVDSGKPPIRLEIGEFAICTDDDIVLLYNKTSRLETYLNLQLTDLTGYRASSHKRKIEKAIEDLSFISSQAVLLKTKAGQGKTNFICDFVSNVILKRDIPCIYINGYELNPADLGRSFSKLIYPLNDYSFSDILSVLTHYCEQNKCPFIIIIEGLNENMQPRQLVGQLEYFLPELLKNNYAKIIMTCRTEYYKLNYSNLSKLLGPSLKEIVGLEGHLSDGQKERILHNYLTHFNVTTTLSDEVESELVENFLMLRIFAEAYEGQTIPPVRHLYKDEIFQKYYEKMLQTISDRLSDVHDFGVSPALQINKFITSITTFMVSNNMFNNIPLDKIIEQTPDNARMYNRFLDENILLRKDIVVDDVFSNREVVNFTYDEFRDYLISEFLIKKLFKEDFESFKDFVEKNTDNSSIISEGLRAFLFIATKKSDNAEFVTFIKSLPWYKEAFLRYIWGIKDDYVNEEDVTLIRELFCPQNSHQIVMNLAFGGRWNTSVHQKLNTKLLNSILLDLTDEELQKCLHVHFPHSHNDFDNRGSLEHLIGQMERILNDDAFMEETDVQYIFEFFSFFIPEYSKVKYVYIDYLKKTNNRQQLEHNATQCKSEILKSDLKEIIEYDFGL